MPVQTLKPIYQYYILLKKGIVYKAKYGFYTNSITNMYLFYIQYLNDITTQQ